VKRVAVTTTPQFKYDTLGTMDDSPLSKLPAELRNRIYELALSDGEPLALEWRCNYLDGQG